MKNYNIQFIFFFSISLVLHSIIWLFYIYGFNFKRNYNSQENIIVLDMIPISSFNNISNQQKAQKEEFFPDSKKIVENNKSNETKNFNKIDPIKLDNNKTQPKISSTSVKMPEIIENIQPVESKISTESVPKLEPKVISEDKTKLEPEKISKVIPQNTPDLDKEFEKLTEKSEKKPSVSKSDMKSSALNLDSLLKNLEKTSEGIGSQNTKLVKNGYDKQTSKGNGDESVPLSINEQQWIKRQIKKHWLIPLGISDNYLAEIVLYIALNYDGSVAEVVVKAKHCQDLDTNFCSILADSAVRAVWKASPIANLNVARYNIWKEFQLVFNPSEMMH